MIALTQEKREELKMFLSASIEKRCTVYTLAKQRELESLRDQVALASLTESAVGSFHIYEQKVDATTDYVRDGEWPIDEGELLVYAAPPVPDIKFPNRNETPDWVMEDDDFCTWYEAETKRLNGWGDRYENSDAIS